MQSCGVFDSIHSGWGNNLRHIGELLNLILGRNHQSHIAALIANTTFSVKDGIDGPPGYLPRTIW
jgi:hypothetical protein